MSEIRIVRADYLDGYRLELLFEDGLSTTVDFEPFLKNSKNPEISKYLNLDLFKTFKVIDGDLDWNDFDLVFPVFDLYAGKISGDSNSSEAS